jgi:hypothetical protein
LLFKRVFKLIEKVSQQPVLFDSIHGSGIHGIIVDMDTKQYTGRRLSSSYQALTNYLGLGQYLSEVDPQHRASTWHLQHMIVFCRVHFQRTILSTIGTRSQGSDLWSRMMSLLDCKSEEDYDTLLDLFISITTYQPRGN